MIKKQCCTNFREILSQQEKDDGNSGRNYN